jgi:hypothetical protein
MQGFDKVVPEPLESGFLSQARFACTYVGETG